MAKKSDRFTSAILRADKGVNSQSRRRQAIGPLIAARGQNAGGRPVLVDAPFWTPKMLPGLTLWHDMSKVTGFVDGQELTVLEDFSGFQRHATPGGAGGTRGVYKTNVANGLPGLFCDGSSNKPYAYAPLGIPLGPRVTFVVGKATNNGPFVAWGRNVAQAGTYELMRNGMVGWDDTLTGFNEADAANLTTVMVLTGWMRSADTTCRRNGVILGPPPLAATVNLNAAGNQPLVMCNGYNGTGTLPLNGYFFECIHVTGELTETQVTTAEYYLMDKWL